ncbi:TonB-dependent receptor [Empedobacter falsenii]|uniref:TonB-dependent receptor n=1 Tax=Empedobacter falsenii TaxID=343874 RepID=UPI0025773D8D|nr:TonB-dependent receptor [Empedobacter falsenii]MDM1297159.1 TonB-dependent receptor [Empedobacter falsenii]MDM1316952.1 TonB-dependent receptor [Empedobacter falsenii]
MKHLLKLSLFILGPFVLAQSGVISGKVVDSNDQFSLPGATIRIENSNKYTVSDQNGNYQFLNLTPGVYTIYIDYLGYETISKQIEVTENKTAVIDFSLNAGYNELNEIVVVGDYLKGQAKALNQQKNNGNITNIISSDQVGRFPDSNIGDALKRVTGVTMQNDQGEARNIIIRGLSPELNSVMLNGDRIPSAEGDNRNVQMDLIPAEMISSIEVNKTLTPDMDADAIGGAVNLITRAVPNKERISVTASGGYAPIREKGLYNSAFLYGNRFFDKKLGVVVSGSYQVQNFGSDNIEAVWDKDENKTYLSQFQIRKYDIQRVRRSASVSADYQFNENNRIDLSAIYNWRDDRENRYRVTYRDLEFDEKTGTYKGNIRRETKGGIDNNRNKNARLEDQRVYNVSLRGEHLLSPKIDMDWAVSYSKASEDRPNERYIDYRVKGVTFNEDLSDAKYPNVTTTSAEDLTKFKVGSLSEQHDYTDETEFGAKLNFRVPLSVIPNQKGRLRFGGRLRLKDKERENIFYSYESIDGMGNLSTQNPVNWSSNRFNAGKKYQAGYFYSNHQLGNLDLNNTNLFESNLEPSEYLASNYKAKEYISAGYIRWDQDLSSKTSLIVGVRIENTSIDYTGNYVQDEEDLIGEIKHKNDYTNVLPSLSLKHKFTNDFILRAAFTTSIARPNYYSLAPFVSVLKEDTELFAGNPNLKATYAMNYDLMAENYFENIGIVSGGFFYKKLNDFIYTYKNNTFTTNDFQTLFPDIANPVPAGENWKMTQARNGDHVNVFGFEVAFQRQLDFIPGEFFKHLGIYLNYTYTDSKAKGITNEDGDLREDLDLPKTAQHMFNGSLAFENKKFSARVSVNYTAAYLDEIGGNAFEDSYYDKQLFLDANASYKFSNQLRIFAEANNLTNQPLRYYQGVSSQTMQLEYYQPRFTLGLKFDF